MKNLVEAKNFRCNGGGAVNCEISGGCGVYDKPLHGAFSAWVMAVIGENAYSIVSAVFRYRGFFTACFSA